MILLSIVPNVQMTVCLPGDLITSGTCENANNRLLGIFSHLLKTTRVINKSCQLNFDLIHLLAILSKYSWPESRILQQKDLESLL